MPPNEGSSPVSQSAAGRPPQAPKRGLRTEIVLAAVAFGLLLWVAGHVLLLVFAGILLGVAVDGLARPLIRHLRLPRLLALSIVLVALVGLIVLGARTIVPQFAEELSRLWQQLSGLIDQIVEDADNYPWIGRMLGSLGENDETLTVGGVAGSVASATVTVIGGLGAAVLVMAIGLFAAADPDLYRRGLIALVPPRRRARAGEVLRRLGYALRWWLFGQLVSMLMLGFSTALGLWLLGVELWLGLGVLVGLLTFVPFLGPILAGIPVVAIGFAEGWQTGVAVLVFYVVLQNIEGNVMTPLIQQRAIRLPPAMMISMQVLLGTVFGIAGLILAAPLAVVTMVVVAMLYVEDVLGDRASM